MKKLGVIVNPIAGIGGRVGLKGSDGAETVREALRRGAVPESPRRAVEALRAFAEADVAAEVIAASGEMGEREARDAGLSPTVVGAAGQGDTTSEHTRQAAVEMERRGVDLLLFAGGDGTARDIHEAVGQRVTALGIPAGVKIHSAVFALDPTLAGELAVSFLRGDTKLTRDAEVMDVDEEAFRRGVVDATLHGYLRVPLEEGLVQAAKSGSRPSEADALLAIAAGVAEEISLGGLYLLGPGATTSAISDALGLPCTLLGVDAVRDGALVGSDLGEREILDLVRGADAKVVVSVIGGQGYVLGRGNQQISAAVVRAVGPENLVIVASREKLAALGGRPLLVDTGDPALDEELSGYVRVTTGYNEQAMYRLGWTSS